MKVIGVEVRAIQTDARNGQQKQELAIWPLEFTFPEVPFSAGMQYPLYNRELEVTIHTTSGDLTARMDLRSIGRSQNEKPSPLEIAAHQAKK